MTEFYVPALPPHITYANCIVNPTNGICFVRLSNGDVLHTGRRGIDLLAEYGSNAKQRSAWCKLAGVKVRDLNAARKRAKDARLKSVQDHQLRSVRASAARLGYTLTKIKPKA